MWYAGLIVWMALCGCRRETRDTGDTYSGSWEERSVRCNGEISGAVTASFDRRCTRRELNSARVGTQVEGAPESMPAGIDSLSWAYLVSVSGNFNSDTIGMSLVADGRNFQMRSGSEQLGSLTGDDGEFEAVLVLRDDPSETVTLHLQW